MAFVIISLITVGVAWFLAPLSQQIIHSMLSGKLDEEQIQQSLAVVERFKYIGFAAAPVTLLLRWSILAALLYFSSVLLDAEGAFKFKTVFAVVVHSELILLLMAVINVLLLYAKGPETVDHVTDLQAIVGLDILVPDNISSLPLFTFLSNINIFSIWYVATLAIGISVITNFSRLKSAILVSVVWLLGVGFQVALTAISVNSQLALQG